MAEEITVCVDGQTVKAQCGDNGPITEGSVGSEFSFSCDGETVNMLVQGGKVFYSVGGSMPSIDVDLVVDSSGICDTKAIL